MFRPKMLVVGQLVGQAETHVGRKYPYSRKITKGFRPTKLICPNIYKTGNKNDISPQNNDNNNVNHNTIFAYVKVHLLISDYVLFEHKFTY